MNRRINIIRNKGHIKVKGHPEVTKPNGVLCSKITIFIKNSISCLEGLKKTVFLGYGMDNSRKLDLNSRNLQKSWDI